MNNTIPDTAKITIERLLRSAIAQEKTLDLVESTATGIQNALGSNYFVGYQPSEGMKFVIGTRVPATGGYVLWTVGLDPVKWKCGECSNHQSCETTFPAE